MAFYRSNELSKFREPLRCAVASAAPLCTIIPILCQLCIIASKPITEVIMRICEWSCLSRSSVSAPTAGSASLTL
jgi:hypothetical protein